jgi:hypothetical protein
VPFLGQHKYSINDLLLELFSALKLFSILRVGKLTQPLIGQKVGECGCSFTTLVFGDLGSLEPFKIKDIIEVTFIHGHVTSYGDQVFVVRRYLELGHFVRMKFELGLL